MYDGVFLSTALSLIGMGMTPVLLDGKRPVFREFERWQVGAPSSEEMQLPEDRRGNYATPDVVRLWANHLPTGNVGVLTRDAPALDIDSPEVWAVIADLVPPTPHCKRGARGFTLLYAPDPADPIKKSRTFPSRFDGNSMLLEALAGGRQTVLPPSIHPSTGLAYEWIASPWGDAPTPLAPARPVLTQSHIDAIEARLRERGLIGTPAKRTAGGVYTVPVEMKRRYEGFLASKVQHQLSRVWGTDSGGRNDALNGACFALAPWIRVGMLSEEWLREQLEAACGPGGNRYIQEDGAGAFCSQFDRAIEAGWDRELPDLGDGPKVEMRPAVPMGLSAPPGAPQASYTSPYFAQPAAPIEAPTVEMVRYDGTLPDEEPEFIKGMLPATPGRLAFIVGQSQAGKSFAACRMAVALTHGLEYMGRRVYERTGVVILAAEGAGGYKARLYAAAREHGVEKQPLPIALVPWSGDFCQPAAMTAVETAIASLPYKVGVVIIDTLSAVCAIEEENDASEANRVCGMLRAFGERVGAVVVPIHHFGKDAGKGMRGSQAFFAAADYVIACTAEIDPVTGEVANRRMAMTKTREGATGPLGAVSLRVVDLGPSRHFGERRTTCVYELEGACPGGELPARRDPDLPADSEIAAIRDHLTIHGERYGWGYMSGQSFKAPLERIMRTQLRRPRYERIMESLQAAGVVERTSILVNRNVTYMVKLADTNRTNVELQS